KENSHAPMLLLYSARSGQEQIFRDELLALKARGGGFSLLTVLTRDTSSRADFTRRVDAAMMREVIARMPEAPGKLYICGSNSFVEAAGQGALAAGIAREAIRTERYGG